MNYKDIEFKIKQLGDVSERTLRFIGSDETPDRDNDIIEVAGWNLDQYIKNPVFLWAHNYNEPPIGKAINVEKDMVTRKLVFDVKFPTADEYPFADTIYKLYKGGYINATSVGFKGVKFKTRDEPEVTAMPEWQRGRRYIEQDLLELSAVPVPSNPNALVQVRSKGFSDNDISKVFTEDTEEKELKEPGWRETGQSFRYRVRDPWKFEQDSFRTIPIQKDKPRVNAVVGILKDGDDSLKIHTIIFPKEDDWTLESAKKWISEHEDITKEVSEKAVIPYKKFSLADEAESWDGPAEISAASVEDLKIMCAWFDSENSDVKQSYKLPHHKQNGYATVWRAVTAAMAALLGARGGVNIPESDRQGVYNHLSKHYKDFDKEPPEFKEYTKIELKEMFPDETKAGATISAKNRAFLEAIHNDMKACHDTMKSCNDRLKQFMDDNMPEEPDEYMAPKTLNEMTVKVELTEEWKQAFEDLKSQMLSLCSKANEADIDLDAIEFVKSSEPPEEPEITPDELKKMISDEIQNQLKGGSTL
ncbi:MAG: HK97 family phage prohead protease [Eubacteriales bacterium]|nr:HK97 family phage prohead protease [Eubacteriales bacterium]